MTMGLILSLSLLAGILLLIVAGAAALSEQGAKLRQHLLTRYETAGASTKAVGPASVAQGPVSLRREAKGFDFRSLFDLSGLKGPLVARISRRLLALMGLGFVGLSGLGIFGLHLPVQSAALLALAIVLVTVFLVYRHRQQKRIAEIAENVPEALDMLVRALRVGAPFPKALLLVSESMSGPIAEEFTLASEEISFGLDLSTALFDLARRCENQDLIFLATAVSIQQGSGGNLAEVLERLAIICRGRQQLVLKVKSLTSEARWSGNLLSVFPIIAAGGIFLINPEYFEDISKSEYFTPLLIAVAVLLVANVIFMRRMLKMKD